MTQTRESSKDWQKHSVEYHFRDKQIEASDALIDEVGALLSESGGAQIIDIFSRDRFAAKAGVLRLRLGFASDLCENKPYGPQEGESWDLSKNSDVNELIEVIAFERPMIVTGSPPSTACSQFQKRELVPRKGEAASNQAVACCKGCLRGTDSCRSSLSA